MSGKYQLTPINHRVAHKAGRCDGRRRLLTTLGHVDRRRHDCHVAISDVNALNPNRECVNHHNRTWLRIENRSYTVVLTAWRGLGLGAGHV